MLTPTCGARIEMYCINLKLSSTEAQISAIGLRVVKWALVRKEFGNGNINLNDNRYKWGACMRCGMHKEKRSVL